MIIHWVRQYHIESSSCFLFHLVHLPPSLIPPRPVTGTVSFKFVPINEPEWPTRPSTTTTVNNTVTNPT
jgi:hypothetical protein